MNAPDKVVDPTRWMPIPFWGRVRPFALERADQFRPPEPPKWGSEALNRDVEEVVRVNADLTLEQKTVVEFMREGPHSTGQSGHWLKFAQDVSRRDHHTLDQDVKLFFAVGNVVMARSSPAGRPSASTTRAAPTGGRACITKGSRSTRGPVPAGG